MAFKKRGLDGLEYVSGDIVEDRAEVIVNTVNSQLSEYGNPVMGKGVALAYKEKWGAAVMRPYGDAIRSGELRPGRALLFDLPDGRKWAALATKDHFRDPSRMEWVESGLKELGEKLRAAGVRSVALTPPGCGNGGLDWRKVEPLVHEHLHGIDKVVLYGKPSGAMIEPDVEKSLAQGLAVKDALKRDSDIRKGLFGKLVEAPDTSFDPTMVPGRTHLVVRMGVREDGSQKVTPVVYRSDEMENGEAHRLIADMKDMKSGTDVSVGGGWKKLDGSEKWSFVAARFAEGRIPLSGLKSSSPSRGIRADAHIAAVLDDGSRDRSSHDVALEGRPAEASRQDDPMEHDGEKVSKRASMYFSFALDGRPDVKSESTFDAILEGERTSTTRYDKWKGSDDWKDMAGKLARFYEDREMKGRSVVVRVDSVRRIDMREFSEKEKEEWSKAEGWAPHRVAAAIRAGHPTGWQIRYTPVPGQDILEGRGASTLARRMEATARQEALREDRQKSDLNALTGGRMDFGQRRQGMAAMLARDSGLGR